MSPPPRRCQPSPLHLTTALLLSVLPSIHPSPSESCPPCQFLLTPSLRVLSTQPLRRGQPLPSTGDPVLHLIDLHPSALSTWRAFSASVIYGGLYEGEGASLTLAPGWAMLSSNANASTANIWSGVSERDEADHPGGQSPLAGSFALDYNLKFVTRGEVRGGEGLRLDRGGSWENHDEQDGEENRGDEGVCLDGVMEASRSDKGRGAFGTTLVEDGSVLAYSPVLPLSRRDLRYLRRKEWKQLLKFNNETADEDLTLPQGGKWRHQLLLNYCMGHENSSVLLFPYGLLVNLINHAPSEPAEDGSVANVGVRWSETFHSRANANRSVDWVDPRTLTPAELWRRPSPEGMVLEYYALRTIRPGEEILLNYGSAWVRAWDEHVEQWNEENDTSNRKDFGVDRERTLRSKDYSPAYIMDDAVSNLRTAEEQLQFPYPDNVFTACFYRYEGRERSTTATMTTSLNEAIPWKMSQGLFEMIYLRPCKVIARGPARSGRDKMVYTALIQNARHSPEDDRIPKGVRHIVSGIPREAFRFVDRPYSSDEHLEGAFRHAIGLEESGIFPEAWLDMRD